MNADRRIVPALHVSAVLAEDALGERTIAVRNTLKNSPHKHSKVAEKWMDSDSMNPLSRVIFKNIEKVPQKPIAHSEKKHESINQNHRHEARGHSGRANFISTGHWFGDHGAYFFGIVGRWLGEMIGYMCTLLAMLLMFGPTRTALCVVLGISVLNVWLGSSLSVWLSAAGCLIIHLIFSFTTKISQGGGGEHEGGHKNNHH